MWNEDSFKWSWASNFQDWRTFIKQLLALKTRFTFWASRLQTSSWFSVCLLHPLLYPGKKLALLRHPGDEPLSGKHCWMKHETHCDFYTFAAWLAEQCIPFLFPVFSRDFVPYYMETNIEIMLNMFFYDFFLRFKVFNGHMLIEKKSHPMSYFHT